MRRVEKAICILAIIYVCVKALVGGEMGHNDLLMWLFAAIFYRVSVLEEKGEKA